MKSKMIFGQFDPPTDVGQIRIQFHIFTCSYWHTWILELPKIHGVSKRKNIQKFLYQMETLFQCHCLPEQENIWHYASCFLVPSLFLDCMNFSMHDMIFLNKRFTAINMEVFKYTTSTRMLSLVQAALDLLWRGWIFKEDGDGSKHQSIDNDIDTIFPYPNEHTDSILYSP